MAWPSAGAHLPPFTSMILKQAWGPNPVGDSSGGGGFTGGPPKFGGIGVAGKKP